MPQATQIWIDLAFGLLVIEQVHTWSVEHQWPWFIELLAQLVLGFISYVLFDLMFAQPSQAARQNQRLDQNTARTPETRARAQTPVEHAQAALTRHRSQAHQPTTLQDPQLATTGTRIPMLADDATESQETESEIPEGRSTATDLAERLRDNHIMSVSPGAALHDEPPHPRSTRDSNIELQWQTLNVNDDARSSVGDENRDQVGSMFPENFAESRTTSQTEISNTASTNHQDQGQTEAQIGRGWYEDTRPSHITEIPQWNQQQVLFACVLLHICYLLERQRQQDEFIDTVHRFMNAASSDAPPREDENERVRLRILDAIVLESNDEINRFFEELSRLDQDIGQHGEETSDLDNASTGNAH